MPTLHVLPHCRVYWAKPSGERTVHLWDYEGHFRICDQADWPARKRRSGRGEHEICGACVRMYVADISDAAIMEVVYE